MMNILQILVQEEAGGAQSRAIKMMHELNRRGYKVNTLFFYVKRNSFDEKTNIIRCLFHKPRFWELPFLFFKFWKYLRKAKPDILLAYTHWGNTFSAPIARLSGIKCVIVNQTLPPERTPIISRIIDNIWGTFGVYHMNICNSRTTYERMLSIISTKYQRRLRFLTLGVDIPKTEKSPDQIRQQYCLPDGMLLVHVGRLSIQKNHENLLKALKFVPDVSIALIGDGELRQNLHNLTNQLQLGKRVFWLGERRASEVAEILQCGDIFLFPSLWEGFGLAPIEACAAGLPVIASNISTFNEILCMETGPRAGQIAALMVDPNDPEAIAEGVKTVLSSKDLRDELKENSEILAKQYSLERMTDDYEKYFAETKELANL